jgi:AbrB family looped-hinge helix DNA binding protein
MTIVHMSEKGQIVVPKNIRDEHGFGNGSAFAVLKTKSGAILFRPVKTAPKIDLVDHLLRLKGLDIPEREHFCPPRT